MPESAEAADHIAVAAENLRAAKVLLAQGFPPEAARSAYYTMHRAARALLAEKGLEARTHKGTLRMFREHFVGADLLAEEMAHHFQDALDTRLRVDYDTGPRPDRDDAEPIVEHAEAFLDAAVKILGMDDFKTDASH